ncbi:phage portal protein [Bacillus cereus]|uniref:phage portal protein n=1 Tax=Bacillus cereus TaxID=1396 RepID=UPI002AC01D6C|nr:phage portal protein [Bacillus cereus]MDZ4427304.1 phage portal protein [Bacillus cereus]
MALKNPFRWGKGNADNGKDYFSSHFFSSKPQAEIDEKQALSIPAVKASVDLISNSIPQLPIYLYTENEVDRSIEKINNDQRTNLFNHSANKYDTAQTLKRQLVQDYLLRDKAYIYKREDNQLILLPAKNVLEEIYTEDYISVAKKEYIYNGMQTLTLNESQVIVIDSGTNGILYDNGLLLQTALSQLDYQNALMQNGAVPTGILKSAARLTETAINRLRTSWDSLYTGTKKVGKTIILEEGLEYQQLSLKPDELGLHEGNKQMISEIARIFNLPESMINSSANKYNSLEQNSLTFLQSTLSPIITAIESSLDKQLLSDTEKQLGFYFRFDTSELLRTTEEEKVKVIEAAFKGGFLSFNEARHKLDFKPVEKDYYSLSIGQVLKYEDGSLINLNTLGQQNNNEVKQQNENKNGTANEPNITEI